MKKINDKGFTLIELLAVIVIMGILMMVAIPAVSRTIENSRKDTFIDIAKNYANSVTTLWSADGLTCDGTVSSAVADGNYFVRINSNGKEVNTAGTGFTDTTESNVPTLLESGGKSSWGSRDVAGYVRVNVATDATTSKRVTTYYIALSDGIRGIKKDDIESSKIVRGNLEMSNLKYNDVDPADSTVFAGSTTAVTPIMCVEN